MPELPEVETVKKGLEKYLKNFLVTKLDVLSERSIASEGGSQVFKRKLQGSIIGKWRRRGKYLIAHLYKNRDSSSGSLVIHLRMTGHFVYLKEIKEPCPHTRVRFWNKEGNELRFIDVRNFGQMWWVKPQKQPEEKINGLKTLGPEPFSKDFNVKYLKTSLKGKTKSIKSALLDQSIFAGTGNIYADESLFMSGINPYKKSGELTLLELEKLHSSLVAVLKRSIGKGGTTFSDFRDLEGLNGNYGGESWVYGREKKGCKKCGALITKKKISGRSSHWCPNCQKQ